MYPLHNGVCVVLPFLVFLLLVSKSHGFGMMMMMSSKEKKDNELMTTCDALMAKSLVLANEATAAAESKLASCTHDLNNMTNKAEELQVELHATTTDLTNRLHQANERISLVQTESKEMLQQQEQKWELAMLQTKEQATYEIHSLNETLQTQLQEKNQEILHIKTHYEKVLSAIRTTALINITTIQTERNATLQALIETHTTQVNTLKQQIKDMELTSTRLVNEAHLDAMARVDAIQKDTKQIISKMEQDAHETWKQYQNNLAHVLEEQRNKKEEYEQSIANVTRIASQQVTEMQTKLQHVQEERKDLNQKYQIALEELAHWEQLHNSQSYCNVTLLQQDALAAVVTVQRLVTNGATKVMHQVMDYYYSYSTTANRTEPHAVRKRWKDHVQTQMEQLRTLYKKHVHPFVQAQMEQLRTLYKKHVHPLVQKHLLPYYKLYAAPLLQNVITESEAWARRAHLYLVTTYQSTVCPKIVPFVPSFLANGVNNLSCQNATKTVNGFLWTSSAMILVLLFVKYLGKSLVSIVLLPWRILLWCFFSPLQLLFSAEKRKPLAEMDQVTKAPVQKEEPTKESATTTSKRVTRSAKVPQ